MHAKPAPRTAREESVISGKLYKLSVVLEVLLENDAHVSIHGTITGQPKHIQKVPNLVGRAAERLFCEFRGRRALQKQEGRYNFGRRSGTPQRSRSLHRSSSVETSARSLVRSHPDSGDGSWVEECSGSFLRGAGSNRVGMAAPGAGKEVGRTPARAAAGD